MVGTEMNLSLGKRIMTAIFLCTAQGTGITLVLQSLFLLDSFGQPDCGGGILNGNRPIGSGHIPVQFIMFFKRTDAPQHLIGDVVILLIVYIFVCITNFELKKITLLI